VPQHTWQCTLDISISACTPRTHNKAEKQEQQQLETRKKRKTVANSMRATSQSCFQLPSQDTLAAFCFLHARHAPCHSHRPLLTPTHHAPSSDDRCTVLQSIHIFRFVAGLKPSCCCTLLTPLKLSQHHNLSI